jgi:hypothetical protein
VLAALGLPAVPAVSCPSVAGALGTAGLGPVCQAASGVAGAATSAASQLTGGFGIDAVLDGLASWVASGAVWLLDQVGSLLSATTTIDLGASWFSAHYRTMAGLTGVVIVPLLLFGIVQAVYQQSASKLVRTAVVHVPLALLLTGVAVQLVQLGLTLTDDMSEAVSAGSGLDTGHFLSAAVAALSAGQVGVPTFVVLLGSLAVVLGAFILWVELVVRSAAVYVAVLFLPLALASLAWPAIAHWCRRLVDTLVALVLTKFVIVAVLSLAAGALAAGTGSTPAGASGNQGGGFTDVLGGAALLLFSAAAPWALFRLLPFVEAGAVGHLEGLGRTSVHSVVGPTKGLAETALRFGGPGSPSGPARVVGGAAGVGGGTGDGVGGQSGGPGGSSTGPMDLAPPPGSNLPDCQGVPESGEKFHQMAYGSERYDESDGTVGPPGEPR